MTFCSLLFKVMVLPYFYILHFKVMVKLCLYILLFKVTTLSCLHILLFKVIVQHYFCIYFSDIVQLCQCFSFQYSFVLLLLVLLAIFLFDHYSYFMKQSYPAAILFFFVFQSFHNFIFLICTSVESSRIDLLI